MEDQEIIREFLVESTENLARVDREMVELERQPQNTDLLASVFRTIHTIKGTCGFLGFTRLEAIAHATENILSELRSGKRELTVELTSVILDAVDAIKRILASIETGGEEGPVFEQNVLACLRGVLGPGEEKDDEPARASEPRRSTLAADPAAGEESRQPKSSLVSDAGLRVDVGLLDRLMDMVGELVLTRNQVLQYNAQREDATLNTVSQRLNLITTELQEGVMKTRMQPIGVVWNKLPRIVRDLATMLRKEIDLRMEGAETELDRTIIEAIKDPLVHIVRNSCDHGIEAREVRVEQGKPARGCLSLRAFHEGGQVNIEISDDGAGMDPQRLRSKAQERGLLTAEQAQRLSDRDAVNLVFLAGFSTAQTVTNISGRGVGMDVVRTSIERIGGTVDLASTPGQGTTVRVKIPLTLAIIPGLVVWAGGERFLVPQASLQELIRLEGDAARTRIEYIQHTAVCRLRDRLIPLADLNQVLGLTSRRSAEEVSILVLQAGDAPFGLIVDTISDTQEIVVKPLGQHLKGLNCYAGATIMGDGKIALILDVAGIAARAEIFAAAEEEGAADRGAQVAVSGTLTSSLLLFRAGEFRRIAMPLGAVSRLESIPRSRVERASGREVVQYRNRLLPLVPLAGMLGSRAECQEEEQLHVVVYRAGSTDLGLVVDEITDIIQENVLSPYGSDRPGLVGSAIVGGKSTDFLDLDAVAGWANLVGESSLANLRRMLSAGEQPAAEKGVMGEVAS
ncbi:MAG: chemotaxis protein CheA [Bryobacteraceae bacterium]|jgi:two-component system chemotaxis sensor kinase CheA